MAHSRIAFSICSDIAFKDLVLKVRYAIVLM
jgi:hypothetical protein